MKILLLGYRKPLYQRLKQRGYKTIVVDSFTKTSNPNFISSDIKDHKNIEDIVRQHRPEYIIAGTEKSVATAARLRDIFDLPGENYDVAKICTNKLEMKAKATELKIPITKYLYIKKGTIPVEQIKDFKYPIVIKSLHESGGRNTVYIKDKNELKNYECNNQLVESYLSGFECSVESLVQNGSILFTNITSYFEKYKKNIIPASFQKNLEEKLLDLNKKIIAGFNVQNSICHTEFYIFENEITFGEIAIRPPGGYIMQLLELTYNVSFWDFFIDLQVGKHIELLPKSPLQYSAVSIIHPGRGRVKSIAGWEEVTQLSTFKEGKLKITTNSVIQERLGSGQDCGYIFFASKNIDHLRQQLQIADSLLSIKIDSDDFTTF